MLSFKGKLTYAKRGRQEREQQALVQCQESSSQSRVRHFADDEGSFAAGGKENLDAGLVYRVHTCVTKII